MILSAEQLKESGHSDFASRSEFSLLMKNNQLTLFYLPDRKSQHSILFSGPCQEDLWQQAKNQQQRLPQECVHENGKRIREGDFRWKGCFRDDQESFRDQPKRKGENARFFRNDVGVFRLKKFVERKRTERTIFL